MHLLLLGYLGESFHSTAYSINVYVTPGQGALRLTRYTREDIESGRGQRIKVTFLKQKDLAKKTDKGRKGGRETSIEFANGAKGKKRKRVEESSEEDEGIDDPIMNDDVGMSLFADDNDSIAEREPMETTRKNVSSSSRRSGPSIRQRCETEGWTFTMADEAPVSAATPSKPGVGSFKPSLAAQSRPSGKTDTSQKGSEMRKPGVKSNRPIDMEIIQIISDSE